MRQTFRPRSRATTSTALLAFGAAVGVGACGGEDVDVGGIWAIFAGSGPAEESELEVRKVLELGGLEVEEAYMFSTLADVTRDDDGNYYVADDVTVTTRVYDPAGGFVRELGRKGEGPGEMVRVEDLVVGEGRVAMVDTRRGGRVALYDTAGTTLDDWMNLVGGVEQLPRALDGDGWLVERPEFSRYPRDLEEGERWDGYRSLRRVAHPTDTAGVEVARWIDQTYYGAPSLIGPDERPPLFRNRAFARVDGHGRIYVSPGFPYRVVVLDYGGDTLRVLERGVEPTAVTERDFEAFRRQVFAVFDTLSEIPDAVRTLAKPFLSNELQNMADVPHAEYRTIVGNVVPAADGSVWVERWDYESPARREVGDMLDIEMDTPNRWDLFDPSGAFVGQVRLPPRFRATHATGRTLTGVLKGEWDLEFVVTWEVVGDPGG